MTRFRTLIAALAILSLIGCNFTPVPPAGEKEGPVGAADGGKAAYVLVLAIERGPDDERTFAACEKLLKELRIERAGEDDKIVLVDLSGPGIVSTVNPRIFRDKYKGGLKDALKTSTGGSKVYQVLTDTLYDVRQRLLDKDAVKAGKAKTSLVVFSPLLDTLSGDRADGKFLYQVGAFDKAGGHCSFYSVDKGEARRWTQAFEDSLRNRWHISTGPEADDIKLPRFGTND